MFWGGDAYKIPREKHALGALGSLYATEKTVKM